MDVCIFPRPPPPPVVLLVVKRTSKYNRHAVHCLASPSRSVSVVPSCISCKVYGSFLSSSTPSSTPDCINPDMVDAISPPIVHTICETCASICQTCSVHTAFPPSSTSPLVSLLPVTGQPLLMVYHQVLSLASSPNSYYDWTAAWATSTCSRMILLALLTAVTPPPFFRPRTSSSP